MKMYRARFMDSTGLKSYIDIEADSLSLARLRAQYIISGKNEQYGYSNIRLTSIRRKKND